MSSQEPPTWQPTAQPPESPPAAAQPPESPPPAGLVRNQMVPGATMIGLGGLLIVLGSFLPWLTATAPFVGTISRNGMEGGDGIITLILGVVVTILIGVSQLTATRMPALLQRSSIVTGVITGAVAIYDYVEVQRRIEDVKEQSELISASVGAGIWTLIVGAILAIVGGVVVRNVPKS
jgi:hypothetical protein